MKAVKEYLVMKKLVLSLVLVACMGFTGCEDEEDKGVVLVAPGNGIPTRRPATFVWKGIGGGATYTLLIDTGRDPFDGGHVKYRIDTGTETNKTFWFTEGDADWGVRATMPNGDTYISDVWVVQHE